MTAPPVQMTRTFAPRWSARGIDPDRARVDFDPVADDLLVYFGGRPVAAVSVPIDDAEADYVSLLVDPETEARISLQIDALSVRIGGRHPAWEALTDPRAPADRRRPTLLRLVADAADFFALYGAGEPG